MRELSERVDDLLEHPPGVPKPNEQSTGQQNTSDGVEVMMVGDDHTDGRAAADGSEKQPERSQDGEDRTEYKVPDDQPDRRIDRPLLVVVDLDSIGPMPVEVPFDGLVLVHD